MASTYAGRIVVAVQDSAGNALVATQVKVLLTGTSTLATLYSNRGKSGAAANPATTDDDLGNLSVWLDPGIYDLQLASAGSPFAVGVSVPDDPDENVSFPTSGTDGQVLTKDAVQALGVKWAAPSGGVVDSDPRLSDTRTPTDSSVTNAKVAPDAAIAESKLALASDAAAGTASRRTLGTGATQAAAGADARLSDSRTPTAHAASHAPAGSDDISGTYATRAYAESLGTGWHTATGGAVATASTGNLTLSGEQTIDGVLTSTSRVLVKNQSAGAENGIYVTAAGAWARATDADAASAAEVSTGLFVFVSAGTVNASSGWVLVTTGAITLNTTALSFQQVSSAGTITGGAGLVKTGSTLDVVAADSTITVAADSIKVATGGITGTEIAAAIKDPAAGTAGLRTLGGGATQAAAGDDPRLFDTRTPTDATVTNAKVAAGAGIAWDKITPPSTAKGDILAAPSAGVLNRLGVGTDGHVLMADVAAPLGVKWGAAPGAAGGDQTFNGKVVIVSDTYYDVRGYGAVLNETVGDDTTAIQNAINAASAAGGGVVFIPAKNSSGNTGKVRISQIKMRRGVTLRGLGPGATTLHMNSTTLHGITIDETAGTVDQFTIEDLKVEGTATAGATADGIHPQHTNNTNQLGYPRGVIRNVIITNAYHGVYLDSGCTEYRLWDVLSKSARADGIRVQSTDCYFINCSAQASAVMGFRVNGASNQLVNCKAFGSTLRGFDISQRHTLVGCLAQENLSDGFRLTGGGYSVLSGCMADSNNEIGFNITTPDHHTLVGCTSISVLSQTHNAGFKIAAGGNRAVRIVGAVSGDTPALDVASDVSGCTVEINGVTQAEHVAAATPTGGLSGEIKVGNGKIWVQDAGVWKSVAVA